MSTPEEFVVITGGPGAGKSTLIDALRRCGFACMPEAARAIIQDQTAIGGHGLHHDDAVLFVELMLAWEMRSYREALQQTGAVFFDRGIAELVAYYPPLGLPVPAHVLAAADRFRYHQRVFIAPPWPEIYVRDHERGQDFNEAVHGYDAAVDAYTRCGYDLITLPKANVDVRVAFILQHLTGQQPDRRLC